jgi:hypothetical protein
MNTLFSFIAFSLLVLASGFGLYKLMGSGEFLDWLIGSLSLIWMFFVVTIPWNAYFKAKEILFEADLSKSKKIAVNSDNVEFAKKIAFRSFLISMLLHITSALVLFGIAHYEISKVGYYSAVLVLLLTLLRPSMRFYEYLQKRLEMIRSEIKFPRDDIETMKSKLDEVYNALDTNPDSFSWRLEIDSKIENLENQIQQIELDFKALSDKLDDNQRKFHKQIQYDLEVLKKENADTYSRIIENGEVTQSLTTLAKYLKKL